MTPVPRALSALAAGNFRRFMVAQVLSNAALWVHRTAHVWLVVVLTDCDPVAVGVVTALQYSPMIPFGLWGGVLGDRFDKRVLSVVTQSLVAVLAVIVAVLIHLEAMTVWWAGAFALALGLPSAIEAPVRLAYPRQLVHLDILAPAVGVNGSVFQVARVVGPALAGGLIVVGGTALAFAIVGVFAIGACVANWHVRSLPEALRPWPRRGVAGPPLLPALREPSLLVPLIGGLLVGVGVTNVQLVVPLLVQEQPGSDGGAYGALLSFIGLGGLVGALLAASVHRVDNARLHAAAGAFTVLSLLFAGLTPGFLMGATLLVLGAAMQVFGTMAVSALQLRSPAGLHGRLMSMYVVTFFLWAPLGGPVFGWLANALGPRGAMATVASVCLVGSVVMGVLDRRSWRRRPDPFDGGLSDR